METVKNTTYLSYVKKNKTATQVEKSVNKKKNKTKGLKLGQRRHSQQSKEKNWTEGKVALVFVLSDLIQLAKNNKEELQRQKQEKNSFSRDAVVTQSKNVRKAYLSTQTKYVGQKRKSNFDDSTLK
jgi:hypothetical protein